MRSSKGLPGFLYGVMAGLLLLSAVLGYALWQQRQTGTVTPEIGGETVPADAETG